MAEPIHIRPARASDTDALLSLIDALADYEKLPRPTAGARERLIRDGFGPRPRFEAYLAELEGRVVGYAMIYETYSSFLAMPALFLEDIFVAPEFRGRGAGTALFDFCRAEAARRGCGRMDWTVLAWNKNAIDFYHRRGARHMEDWQVFRLMAQDY